MAQVKIYGFKSALAEKRERLSAAVHAALVDALAVPEDKCFQRFIGLEPGEFVYPADRGPHYIILEISMFEGRSTETKKALIRALFARIEREVGIAPHSVEITLFETPRQHWGIRGKCGDELALSYKVDV
jgi:phenylpyruvate tautomerase PptA (4-oxalocrotonate tautomerase family)